MNKLILFYFIFGVHTTLAHIKHSNSHHLFHSNRSKQRGESPIVYETLLDDVNGTTNNEINLPNLPCDLGDNKCIEDALNNLFRSYPKGFRSAKFPSIEPFHLKRFDVIDERNAEEGYRAKFISKNLNYTGIGNSIFSVSGFEDDINECNVTIKMIIPKCVVEADYNMRLRFHKRYSYGKGKLHWSFDDLTFIITFDPKIYKNETDAKHYLRLHNFDVDYIVTKANLDFGDLFDGMDKEATINEHQYINTNIMTFFKETKFSGVPEFQSIFLHVINPMLERNSIDRIFNLNSISLK